MAERPFAALLVFVATLAASPALAQAPDADAHLLYTRGDAAYAEGRYDVALAFFQEAYDLSHRPALLYNLANTLERLGRNAEAIAKLHEFLPSAPDNLRSVVETRITVLEDRETQRVAAEEAQRRAAAEATARERAAHDAEERAAVAAAAAAAARRERERLARTAPSRDLPWGQITLYAVATAAAGLAVGFGVLAHDADERARAGCHELPGVGSLCSSQVSGDLSTAQSYAITTDVLIVSSALALAGAVVWTLLDGSAHHDTAHVAVTVVPWPFGVVVAGRL